MTLTHAGPVDVCKVSTHADTLPTKIGEARPAAQLILKRSVKERFVLAMVFGSKSGVAPVQGGFTGEASAYDVDHREADHGFGAVRVGLVVAGEAAVVHEPAEGSLDDPASRDHLEALRGGIPVHGIDVPATEQGVDAAKNIVGRKRSVVIDTTGLLLTVLVTAASVQDSTAGETLLNRIAAAYPTIRKCWADRGYREYLVDHAARLGIDLEIVRRDPSTRGFTVQPHRWAVERTLGWLMHHRRLARDYEALPARSTAMIYPAMIALMARRLTRESTPTWRGL